MHCLEVVLSLITAEHKVAVYDRKARLEVVLSLITAEHQRA